LIGLKNVRRRIFQTTHDPALKIVWRDLQKLMKKRLSALRNKYLADNISNLDASSKPFRKLTNILKNPQKTILALKEGNKTLFTNADRAHKLAKQFESAHNFSLDLTSPIESQVSQN
jgi:superoxide dismutase